jgi:hypothetical protein
MATPPLATLAVPAALGLASLAPGVDGNALIGAFAGAAFVAFNEPQAGTVKRTVHALISFVMGYMAAPEIVAVTVIRSTGMAAFFCAALLIAVTVQLMGRISARIDISLFKKRD